MYGMIKRTAMALCAMNVLLAAGSAPATAAPLVFPNLVLTMDTIHNNPDAIIYQGTIDGATGGEDLTSNTTNSGNITFNGPVGNTSPLGNLTTNADGIAEIQGGSINTVGSQTFNNGVTLGANTTLTSNDVTFAGSVDGATSGGQQLIVSTSGGGVTVFGDTIGAATELGSLSTNADGVAEINANIRTTGGQTYNDRVLLGSDVTLTGNDITFNGTIDSATGGADLTVVSSGNGVTALNDSVGGATPLGNLTTNSDGSTHINTPSVTTTGDQTYSDRVLLGSDVTLTGNDVTIAGSIDGATSGGQQLIVSTTGSGVTVFGDTVGAATELGSLTTNSDGSTHINTPSVTTTGNQTYNDVVEIAGDTTLTAPNVFLNSGANFDIGGSNPTDYEQITVGGLEFIAGVSKVELFAAFTPGLGDVFDVVTAAAIDFSGSYMFPSLGGGLAWSASVFDLAGVTAQTLRLEVITAALPEPGTLTVLAIGLVGLTMAKRKRAASTLPRSRAQ